MNHAVERNFWPLHTDEFEIVFGSLERCAGTVFDGGR